MDFALNPPKEDYFVFASEKQIFVYNYYLKNQKDEDEINFI